MDPRRAGHPARRAGAGPHPPAAARGASRRGSYVEFWVQEADLEIARAINLYRVSWHSKGRRDPSEIDLVILFRRPFDARHIVAREKGGDAIKTSPWYVDRRFAHLTLHAPAKLFSVAIT